MALHIYKRLMETLELVYLVNQLGDVRFAFFVLLPYLENIGGELRI